MRAGTVKQVIVQTFVECTYPGSVTAFSEVVAVNSKCHVCQIEPVSCHVYCAVLSDIRYGLNSCKNNLCRPFQTSACIL